MRPTHIAILLAAPALFVACENPAAKTTDAKISDAVEKTTSDAAGGTKYVFTPESEIKFIGSKITGSHAGGFKTFSGHFTIADGAPVGNDHQVTIDMTSTWSDDERLTGHLKAPDFFDVEKFPESVFDVTAITKTGDLSYDVSGNFTLHGVTKNITIPANVTRDGETVRINSRFDINRKDFGIVYPGKPDDLIRDEVVIELNLAAQPEA